MITEAATGSTSSWPETDADSPRSPQRAPAKRPKSPPMSMVASFADLFGPGPKDIGIINIVFATGVITIRNIITIASSTTTTNITTVRAWLLPPRQHHHIHAPTITTSPTDSYNPETPTLSIFLWGGAAVRAWHVSAESTVPAHQICFRERFGI